MHLHILYVINLYDRLVHVLLNNDFAMLGTVDNLES
jgi:hypothetical protein